jgi:hypothetical protein
VAIITIVARYRCPKCKRSFERLWKRSTVSLFGGGSYRLECERCHGPSIAPYETNGPGHPNHCLPHEGYVDSK